MNHKRTRNYIFDNHVVVSIYVFILTGNHVVEEYEDDTKNDGMYFLVHVMMYFLLLYLLLNCHQFNQFDNCILDSCLVLIVLRFSLKRSLEEFSGET